MFVFLFSSIYVSMSFVSQPIVRMQWGEEGNVIEVILRIGVYGKRGGEVTN